MNQNILDTNTTTNNNSDHELENQTSNSIPYIQHLFKRRYELIKMFNLVQILFLLIIVVMLIIREYWKLYYIIIIIASIFEILTEFAIFQILIVSIWPVMFNLDKTSFKKYNIIGGEIMTSTKSNEKIKCNLVLKKDLLSKPIHSISIPIQLEDNTPSLVLPIENDFIDSQNNDNIYIILSNIESTIKSNSLLNSIIEEYKKKIMVNLHSFETFSNEISFNKSGSSFTYYIGNKSKFSILISILSVVFFFSTLHYKSIISKIKFKHVTYYKMIDLDKDALLIEMNSNEELSKIIDSTILNTNSNESINNNNINNNSSMHCSNSSNSGESSNISSGSVNLDDINENSDNNIKLKQQLINNNNDTPKITIQEIITV